MIQQSLNEWDVINEQIERSKIKRINWENIFTESLTAIVARYYKRKFDAEQTYQALKNQLLMWQIDNPELLRRLKIGVCARFGEIKTQQRIIGGKK